MHSSTSSSNDDVYIRMLPDAANWRRILSCTIAVTIVGIGCTEYYARSQNYPVLFETSPDLWATQWFRFEAAEDNQTVIVGASRNKFGVLIDLWEEETGTRPIMLAWPASSPLPVLNLISERESYRGTIICGIAPSFSFASPDNPQQRWIHDNLKTMEILRFSLSYYISTPVRRFLKHRLLSLNTCAFSPIFNLRDGLQLENRKGTRVPMQPVFWANQREDLQDDYLESAASDEHIMEQIRDMWRRIMFEQIFFGTAQMDQLIGEYVQAVRRIEEKGGRVIFVRHPSSDDFLDFEQKHYPRQLFFDRLVNETGCFGIHFKDYPEISNYKCPEWSHLTPDDARDYTRKIIKIINKHTPDAI